jgi:hypothetical protein
MILALALLPLSACAPIDAGGDDDTNASAGAPPMSKPLPAEPVPGTSPSLEGECDAKAAQAYIGKTASAEVVAQAKAAAGAAHVRTLKPGQMVTMEFRAGRLNLDVDGNNVITNARCG